MMKQKEVWDLVQRQIPFFGDFNNDVGLAENETSCTNCISPAFWEEIFEFQKTSDLVCCEWFPADFLNWNLSLQFLRFAANHSNHSPLFTFVYDARR